MCKEDEPVNDVHIGRRRWLERLSVPTDYAEPRVHPCRWCEVRQERVVWREPHTPQCMPCDWCKACRRSPLNRRRHTTYVSTFVIAQNALVAFRKCLAKYSISPTWYAPIMAYVVTWHCYPRCFILRCLHSTYIPLRVQYSIHKHSFGERLSRKPNLRFSLSVSAMIKRGYFCD